MAAAPERTGRRIDPLGGLPDVVIRNRIVNKAQVAALIDQHPCQIDRLVKAGRFPPPLKIGARKGGWRLATVLDHLERAETAAL
jgi:predicted DNA-binding transcriptional regulator AlpA